MPEDELELFLWVAIWAFGYILGYVVGDNDGK